MKVRSILPILIIGTLTAYAQNPDASAQPHPAATAQAAPAAPVVAPGQPTAEQIKDLNDGLKMFQLDGLAVQTAQNTFTQTDPVAKRAMQILTDAMKNSEDINKARAQMDNDQKALLAKIDALRKAQNPPLDDTWDWDFAANRFIKKPSGAQPAAAPVATPAAPGKDAKPKKG